jgi:hypothetical protein
MGLLDVLLRREKHVLYSPLSFDESRRRLLGGAYPTSMQFPIVSPFTVMWSHNDYATMRFRGDNLRAPTARVLRVRLVADGSGTAVEAIAESPWIMVAVGVLATAMFVVVGVAFTIDAVSRGKSLRDAVYPFGLVALIPLLLMIVRFLPSSRGGELVANLRGLLAAT